MIRFCNKQVLNNKYIQVVVLQDRVTFDMDIWKNAKYYFASSEVKDAERLLYLIKEKMLQGVCYDVVSTEGIVLETDVWEDAAGFFECYKSSADICVLLPIVDKAGRVICYAYEDSDADREVRMLNELKEIPNILQFTDVYPEYEYVKIYGFNELAYYFAQYLESLGIAVTIEDELYQFFFAGKQCKTRNDKCLEIYAEGTLNDNNLLDKLLWSVSSEFEYIDKIYEANIEEGFIKDVEGNLITLIQKLKLEKEIVICGTGMVACDVYDFLVENGIDICCFLEERNDRKCHRLFGKKIMSSQIIRKLYKNPVFIECNSKNSSWGFGGVDYYDYLGYRRNRNYFLIKDYTDIKSNHLANLLQNKKMILAGNIFLCNKMLKFLEDNQISVMGYLSGEGAQLNKQENIPRICKENVDKDMICLIVIPEFFSAQMQRKKEKEKRHLEEYLKRCGINDYTDYFSHILAFIEIEEKNRTISKSWLRPKRIILGSIEHSSGNVYVKELLDGHPSILMETDWRYLDDKLFWLCICLSLETKENILFWFRKLYEDEWEGKFYNIELFKMKLKELLVSGSDEFTSQDLFVMFHIAYMYMYGIDVQDVTSKIIYWEPHDIPRPILEECVRWLGGDCQCDILNVVRNIYMRHGSGIKGRIKMGWNSGLDVSAFSYIIWNYPSIDKKNFYKSKRYILKFEELKLNSSQLLLDLCNEWSIEWSETLMKTTCKENADYENGLARGFDLKPVYNLYEEYFSEFDRFRMSLMNAPYQKKYGYPYVEISEFSRKELLGIFLKKNRFENIEDNGTKKKTDLRLQKMVMLNLQKLKRYYYIEKSESENL